MKKPANINVSVVPGTDTNPNIETKQKVAHQWASQSPAQVQDWGIIDAYQANPPLTALEEHEKIPDSLNLSEDVGGNKKTWWAIVEQGKNHSCVGWAVADLLRWHFVDAGYLEQDMKLSARYIWMAAKETDEINNRPTTFIENEGSTIKAALDVARKYGIVTESFFSSEGNGAYQGSASEFYARAANLKISSYFNLINESEIPKEYKFTVWRTWLYYNGPIIVRINMDGIWCDNGEGKQRFDLTDYDEADIRGGHSILLTGYTTEGDFIVRNSWGTKWGNDGYALVSESYADKAFDEAYGVCIPNREKIIKTVGWPHKPSGFPRRASA